VANKTVTHRAAATAAAAAATTIASHAWASCTSSLTKDSVSWSINGVRYRAQQTAAYITITFCYLQAPAEP